MPDTLGPPLHTFSPYLRSWVFLQKSSDNIFDNLPALTAPAQILRDELSVYLSAPCERPEQGDALRWWARNAATYPRLSRMALDYLSIPGA